MFALKRKCWLSTASRPTPSYHMASRASLSSY
nr:MAG TPA: hypothetical protein [Caudoviricetes sp.]